MPGQFVPISIWSKFKPALQMFKHKHGFEVKAEPHKKDGVTEGYFIEAPIKYTDAISKLITKLEQELDECQNG